MKSPQRIRLLFVVALVVGLVGCASYPISKQYREEASPAMNFTTVQADPSSYNGSIVIWGGRIVKTTNTPKGSQVIVLNTPLSGYETPTASNYSPGRFIAETPQFLAPDVYRPGARITIAGEVMGGEKRPLGKVEYTYPVIAIKQLHLWPAQRYNAYEPMDYWPWWVDTGWAYNPNYWNYPFYGNDEGYYGEGEGEFEGGEEGGGEEGGEPGDRGEDEN
jgi:outer membrane lipoprotein